MLAARRICSRLSGNCVGPLARPYSVRVAHVSHSLHQPEPQVNQVTNIADLKAWKPTSSNVENVEISGWVRSVRKSSAVRFVDVYDGSSLRPVQVVVEKDMAIDLRPGAAVNLTGTWHTPGDQERNPELQVKSLEILGPSDPETYPIQNKYQTFENLRNIPHLRPRMPLNGSLLRLRSDAMAVLSQFFSREKFHQTHPPIITSSDCEGAGEAFSVKAGKEEFFKGAKYLTVSSQLHLEAMAQALGDVWTLSPTFRAEQSDTSRHLSEFYMLEAEMSFVQDMDGVMDHLQRMLNALASGLRQMDAARELDAGKVDAKNPMERLAFEDLESRDTLRRRWNGLMTPSRWPRITYTEAIDILKSSDQYFEHPPTWGAGLQSEHEKYLATKIGYDEASDASMPIFVTHYPREIKAFYMRQSPDDKVVDCFDLLVPDLGELAGGSMREHRLAELEANMRLHGLHVPSKRESGTHNMGWYLDLRRWGSPPHGGYGLGFDRLLSYLTGVQSVRDIVPFPRYFGRSDC